MRPISRSLPFPSLSHSLFLQTTAEPRGRESAQQVEKHGRPVLSNPVGGCCGTGTRGTAAGRALPSGAQGPGQRRGGGGRGDLAAARYYYMTIVSTGVLAEINPPSKQLLYVAI